MHEHEREDYLFGISFWDVNGTWPSDRVPELIWYWIMLLYVQSRELWSCVVLMIMKIVIDEGEEARKGRFVWFEPISIRKLKLEREEVNSRIDLREIDVEGDWRLIEEECYWRRRMIIGETNIEEDYWRILKKDTEGRYRRSWTWPRFSQISWTWTNLYLMLRSQSQLHLLQDRPFYSSSSPPFDPID